MLRIACHPLPSPDLCSKLNAFLTCLCYMATNTCIKLVLVTNICQHTALIFPIEPERSSVSCMKGEGSSNLELWISQGIFCRTSIPPAYPPESASVAHTLKSPLTLPFMYAMLLVSNTYKLKQMLFVYSQRKPLM